VQFLGADADFGPETELSAVGEGSAGVGVNDGSVDLAEVAGAYGLVVTDDGFAVATTVPLDVGNGLRYVGAEAFVGCFVQEVIRVFPLQGGVSIRVGKNLAAVEEGQVAQ